MGESSRQLLILPALERIVAWTTTSLTFRIPTTSVHIDGGKSCPALDFSVLQLLCAAKRRLQGTASGSSETRRRTIASLKN